jgi:quinol monooxygenase YgiN
MTLGNISTLEVCFAAPVENVFIDNVEMILDVLKTHDGCLGYAISSLQHVSNSILITGYWRDEESMLRYFSSVSFSELFESLIPRSFSLRFKTFFMRSESEGCHVF